MEVLTDTDSFQLFTVLSSSSFFLFSLLHRTMMSSRNHCHENSHRPQTAFLFRSSCFSRTRRMYRCAAHAPSRFSSKQPEGTSTDGRTASYASLSTTGCKIDTRGLSSIAKTISCQNEILATALCTINEMYNMCGRHACPEQCSRSSSQPC